MFELYVIVSTDVESIRRVMTQSSPIYIYINMLNIFHRRNMLAYRHRNRCHLQFKRIVEVANVVLVDIQ